MQKNEPILKQEAVLSLANLKDILEKYFVLPSETIITFLENNAHRFNDIAINKLANLLSEFSSSVGNYNYKDAKLGEKQATFIKTLIEIYATASEEVSQDFIECVNKAVSLGIDPFAFACKTNIRNASVEKFDEAIDALMIKSYPFFEDEKKQMFDKEETTQVLSKCVTLMSDINQEYVEDDLRILHSFFYNNKSEKFVPNIREIVKRAPSILLLTPKKLEYNIKQLQLMFGDKMSKEKLAERISFSPSILSVNVAQLDDTILSIANVFVQTMEKFPREAKPKKIPDIALNDAEKLILNLNHITVANKIKLECLQDNSAILTKYLGAENAYSCLQNFTVLNKEPELVEYVLAAISLMPNNDDMRRAFVNSPTKFLTEIKINSIINNSDSSHIEREKKEIIIKDLPKVEISPDTLKLLSKKVNVHDKKFVDELIEKAAKKEEERRKARLEQKLREKEERAKQKAEEKRKAQEAKRTKRENISINKNTEIVNVQEVMANRMKILKESMAKINVSHDSPSDAFISLYTPIIEAFKKSKTYCFKAPSFTELSKLFKEVDENLITRLTVFKKAKSYQPILMQLARGLSPALTTREERNEKYRVFMKPVEQVLKTNCPEQLQGKPYCEYLEIILNNITNDIARVEKDTKRIINKKHHIQNYEKIESKMPVKQSKIPSFNQLTAVRTEIADYTELIKGKVREIFGDEGYDFVFNGQHKQEYTSFNDGLEHLVINPALSSSVYAKFFLEPFISEIVDSYERDGLVNFEMTEKGGYNVYRKEDKIEKITDGVPKTELAENYNVSFAKFAASLGNASLFILEKCDSNADVVHDENLKKVGILQPQIYRADGKDFFIYDFVDVEGSMGSGLPAFCYLPNREKKHTYQDHDFVNIQLEGVENGSGILLISADEEFFYHTDEENNR